LVKPEWLEPANSILPTYSLNQLSDRHWLLYLAVVFEQAGMYFGACAAEGTRVGDELPS
jgi:hypothetical protein